MCDPASYISLQTIRQMYIVAKLNNWGNNEIEYGFAYVSLEPGAIAYIIFGHHAIQEG